MKKRLIAALFIGVGLCTPAWAMFEVEGFLWLMTPGGDASVGIDGLQGTKVDLETDLGYDETESVPGLRFIAGKMHQFGFSGFQISASAENTIDRTFFFMDKEFRFNERVSTSFDVTVLQAYYRLNLGPEVFHGGLIAGGEYITAEATAASARMGQARADLETGMFLLGAFAETDPVPFLRLRASLMGGTFDISDIKARYLDFEFAAFAQFSPGFHVGGGYRYIDLDAEDTQVPLEINLAFKGPFLLVGFEW